MLTLACRGSEPRVCTPGFTRRAGIRVVLLTTCMLTRCMCMQVCCQADFLHGQSRSTATQTSSGDSTAQVTVANAAENSQATGGSGKAKGTLHTPAEHHSATVHQHGLTHGTGKGTQSATALQQVHGNVKPLCSSRESQQLHTAVGSALQSVRSVGMQNNYHMPHCPASIGATRRPGLAPTNGADQKPQFESACALPAGAQQLDNSPAAQHAPAVTALQQATPGATAAHINQPSPPVAHGNVQSASRQPAPDSVLNAPAVYAQGMPTPSESHHDCQTHPASNALPTAQQSTAHTCQLGTDPAATAATSSDSSMRAAARPGNDQINVGLAEQPHNDAAVPNTGFHLGARTSAHRSPAASTCQAQSDTTGNKRQRGSLSAWAKGLYC